MSARNLVPDIRTTGVDEARIQEALAKVSEARNAMNRELDSVQATLRSLLTIDWEGGYEQAIAAWQKFLKPGDAALPDLVSVRGAFKPEQYDGIATLRGCRLILVPQTSFAEMVRRIDSSGIKLLRRKTYVNEGVFGPVDREGTAENISAWQPTFIEGAVNPGIVAGDDAKKILSGRVVINRDARAPGKKGTHRFSYAALMMQSLSEGNPVDVETWTAFDNDEACSQTCLPHGYFGVGQVYFDGDHPGGADGYARFRSSVEGDVLH